MQRIVTDDTILPNEAREIFEELVNSFPEEADKRLFGKKMINTVAEVIKAHPPVMMNPVKIQEKLNVLSKKADELEFDYKKII